MATFVWPMIRAQDYEAFRRLPIRGLPETFNAWAHEREKAAAQLISSGHIVEDVEVYPHEFAAFCRERRTPADTNALDRFADEKFRRHGAGKGEMGRGVDTGTDKTAKDGGEIPDD